jgi:hypothetical protein
MASSVKVRLRSSLTHHASAIHVSLRKHGIIMKNHVFAEMQHKIDERLKPFRSFSICDLQGCVAWAKKRA